MFMPVRVTIVAHQPHRRSKRKAELLAHNVRTTLESLRKASYVEKPVPLVVTEETDSGRYWAITVMVSDRKRAPRLLNMAIVSLERDAELDLAAEDISVSLTV